MKFHILREIFMGVPARVDKSWYISDCKKYIVAAVGYPSGWYGETQEWAAFHKENETWQRISTRDRAKKAKNDAEKHEANLPRT